MIIYFAAVSRLLFVSFYIYILFIYLFLLLGYWCVRSPARTAAGRQVTGLQRQIPSIPGHTAAPALAAARRLCAAHHRQLHHHEGGAYRAGNASEGRHK